MSTISQQLLGGVNSKEVSVINDPFNKDSTGDIFISYSTSWGKPYWWAKVDFKNGNTSGSQKTPEVATFQEVIIHLKQILDSLQK